MEKFSQDVLNWPLWSQLLLLVVLGLVAHFWFGRLFSSLIQKQTTGWKSSRLWLFTQCLFCATVLSWLAVRFCVGVNGQGKAYEWGFYGRVLFIGLTAYLTNFLTRHFS